MRQPTRSLLPRLLSRGAIGLLIVLQSGCIPIEGTEFRDAALPAIETGINAILDGLVDGIFAVIEPEAGNASN